MSITKEYPKGEITVLWKPQLCIHSEICVKGLPAVFKPHEKPWIQLDSTDTDKIINQVKACPSGALAMKKVQNKHQDKTIQDIIQISVVEKGPLIVMGDLEVRLVDGTSEMRKNQAAFCRCGKSDNKPYCDGTHTSLEFEE